MKREGIYLGNDEEGRGRLVAVTRCSDHLGRDGIALLPAGSGEDEMERETAS